MKQKFTTLSEYKDLLNDLPEFNKLMSELAKDYNATLTTVSYTHLTLPTKA